MPSSVSRTRVAEREACRLARSNAASACGAGLTFCDFRMPYPSYSMCTSSVSL